MEMNEIKNMIKLACDALEDKKGENINIINVGEVSVIADYFIIAGGTNRSQIQALAFIIANGTNNSQNNAMVDSVDEALSKAGYHHNNIEGINNSSWILMDYGDIIVHIFSREDRDFYNLEHIWGDCKVLTKEDL